MKNKMIYLVTILSIFLLACDDSEDTPETNVITSNGTVRALDGTWRSDCIDFTTHRLTEDFEFEGDQLTITIYQSSGETCESPDETQTVAITFQVLGTIEASLEGETVVGNKISGTQRIDGSSQSSTFKQTFYILEHGDKPALYHGVFEDDGGAVSSDGFPIELHPFAISQL